jgi:hypothetical protein
MFGLYLTAARMIILPVINGVMVLIHNRHETVWRGSRLKLRFRVLDWVKA